MSDLHKICYDRILPKDMNRPMRTIPAARGAGPSRAVSDMRKLWINGSTLRVRFMDGTAEQQQLVREQAAWWLDTANLKFDFNNAVDAEIRITFDPADGAWSFVGTDAKSIPQSQPTMNLGFLDGGTAAHEFGHAIGLGHEHQNPEGGIEWNEAVVIRDLNGPPNYWTADQVRHNVLEKYKVDQYLRASKFDPDSIMLYAFPGTWTKSGKGTKMNTTLSAEDKEFIGGQDIYPKQNIEQVTLQLNSAAPTEGQIGVPGEEDVYQFTAPSAGRYVIETGGNADVVMKLFGPDSQTTLVAEDDDGGVGFNSRIAAALAPGRYFVQIRHYNRTSGTGAYSIAVTNGA